MTNKSKRIQITSDNKDQDKYIYFNLEQDVDTYQLLSLDISQKDIYRFFNADYGVLIGRVLANNNIGVPNVRISIFIPITTEDQQNSDIVSIYPYSTPRDLNLDGKRYNLLPRVSSYNQETGTYKPKQPFGSFPLKEELVMNDTWLNVYKKYYKYNTVTNEYGDYMIFGVPTGVQTIHMSSDITDIGKYSMIPQSMLNLGYSSYLFTDDNTKIKPSNDLSILPNVETQEIATNILPYWGDTSNFEIGITRQDFKIRANVSGNFSVFGTTTQMGEGGTIGDPDSATPDILNQVGNAGFYYYNGALNGTHNPYEIQNNYDLRTFRPASFTIRVFSYTTTTPIEDITGTTNVDNINYDTAIYELPNTTYYEYNKDGDFVLNIPCNRTKIITDENGIQILVDDSSPNGIFTEFYGMFIFEYPEQTIIQSFSHKFQNGPSIARLGYGKFKFPQSNPLMNSTNFPTAEHINNLWRHENYKFEVGKIYSIAQFLPVNYFQSTQKTPYNVDWSANVINNVDVSNASGLFFKVAGLDQVTQNSFDSENYVLAPSGDTHQFIYDFPDNAYKNGDIKERLFGAQWINLTAFFPQYVWATRAYGDRNESVADFLFGDSYGTYFVEDNTQKLFAGIINSKGFVTGNSWDTEGNINGCAFETAFIEIPSTELAILNSDNIPFSDGRPLSQVKGINVTLFNQIKTKEILDLTHYKYRVPNNEQKPLTYKTTATDVHSSEYIASYANGKSAFLFKGQFGNNPISKLFSLNIL